MYFGPLRQCVACIEEPKTGCNAPNAVSRVSDKWELLLLSTYTVLLSQKISWLVKQEINSILFVYTDLLEVTSEELACLWLMH